jgi:uncharacterized membrane protein YhaH (DUF805 family)
MNFIEALKSVFTKYIDFNGRASRAEYWWFFLFNIIVNVLTSFVDGYIDPSGVGVVGLVVSLGLLVPGLAVAIRRIHDVGKSGWFILIPIYNLILVLTAGQVGTNEYGTDPYGSELEDDINAIGNV